MDVVASTTARGKPSYGVVTVTSSPFLAVPRAPAEKSMLRQEVWPPALDFDSLAQGFTDESKRVTSHFLTELDMACSAMRRLRRVTPVLGWRWRRRSARWWRCIKSWRTHQCGWTV